MDGFGEEVGPAEEVKGIAGKRFLLEWSATMPDPKLISWEHPSRMRIRIAPDEGGEAGIVRDPE